MSRLMCRYSCGFSRCLHFEMINLQSNSEVDDILCYIMQLRHSITG